MTVQVRAMTVADLPAVLRLWAGVPEVELNDADTPEKLTVYLERNPKLSPVALTADKIVGAAICGHDGRRGYLHHLAVAAPHRQRGVGQTLVNYCLTQLSKLELSKCNIFVSPENNTGLAFWRRLEFQEQSWTLLQRRTQ